MPGAVAEGAFASQSAAVAEAPEQIMRDEEKRDLALAALADVIQERLKAPLSDYVDAEKAFGAARARIAAASRS